jgi:hypothetical protein
MSIVTQSGVGSGEVQLAVSFGAPNRQGLYGDLPAKRASRSLAVADGHAEFAASARFVSHDLDRRSPRSRRAGRQVNQQV